MPFCLITFWQELSNGQYTNSFSTKLESHTARLVLTKKSKNVGETALTLCASHGALGLPEPSLHVAFQTHDSLQIQAGVALM